MHLSDKRPSRLVDRLAKIPHSLGLETRERKRSMAIDKVMHRYDQATARLLHAKEIVS